MPVIVTGEQAEVTDGTVQVMCLDAPLSRIGRARPGDAEASTHVATGGRAPSSGGGEDGASGPAVAASVAGPRLAADRKKTTSS